MPNGSAGRPPTRKKFCAEKGDKRLLVMDEEFASGLACTRREGNTLSMGIRSFWDSGD